MRVERIALAGGSWGLDLEAACSPYFNVIIGQNGAGKTYLLRLLRQVVGRWITGLRLPLQPSHQYGALDVRIEGTAPDGREFSAVLESERIDSRSRPRGRGLVAYEGEPDDRSKRFWAQLSNGEVQHPPLLAHAGPQPRTPLFHPTEDGRRPTHLTMGWRGALDLVVAPGQHDWYKRPIGGSLTNTVISTVRHALQMGVAGVGDVRWTARRGVETRIGESWIEVRHLPESFQAMMCLVGGLAWRAALLRGTIGEDAAQLVEGVVLLEEIERYLDLNWQRRVVSDLRRAFPRVQFFATTHSPFVVQSMRAEEVINLDGRRSLNYQKSSVEDIVEAAMGVPVPQRSQRWQLMYRAAAEFFEKLDHLPEDVPERIAGLRLLDELTAPFADDPAFTAFLARKRVRVLE